MFEKTLEFVIILCYGLERKIILQQGVFKVEIWIIAKAFIKVLNLVVIACVMN
jgi:hypothetical protein